MTVPTTDIWSGSHIFQVLYDFGRMGLPFAELPFDHSIAERELCKELSNLSMFALRLRTWVSCALVGCSCMFISVFVFHFVMCFIGGLDWSQNKQIFLISRLTGLNLFRCAFLLQDGWFGSQMGPNPPAPPTDGFGQYSAQSLLTQKWFWAAGPAEHFGRPRENEGERERFCQWYYVSIDLMSVRCTTCSLFATNFRNRALIWWFIDCYPTGPFQRGGARGGADSTAEHSDTAPASILVPPLHRQHPIVSSIVVCLEWFAGLISCGSECFPPVCRFDSLCDTHNMVFVQAGQHEAVVLRPVSGPADRYSGETWPAEPDTGWVAVRPDAQNVSCDVKQY